MNQTGHKLWLSRCFQCSHSSLRYFAFIAPKEQLFSTVINFRVPQLHNSYLFCLGCCFYRFILMRVSYASFLALHVQCYNFFFRKKRCKTQCKERYSSLIFAFLISWSEKFWGFWFDMFLKYLTEGSRKLLVTFLSAFSSATASNSKVSALKCWYGTLIQKCCIHDFCLCNRRGILPLLLFQKQSLRRKFLFIIDYWPLQLCVICILITRS